MPQILPSPTLHHRDTDIGALQGAGRRTRAAQVSRGPLERWSWTLQPRENHVSDAHNAGALELVKASRGTLTLEVGGETVQVKAGHSAWFDASRQHAYRNASSTQVMFTLVVLDSAAIGTREAA